jgi:hypothetical protein
LTGSIRLEFEINASRKGMSRLTNSHHMTVPAATVVVDFDSGALLSNVRDVCVILEPFEAVESRRRRVAWARSLSLLTSKP